MTHQLSLRAALKLEARLRLTRQRSLAFEIAGPGELQFAAPIIREYAIRHPADLLVISHRGDPRADLVFGDQDLGPRLVHLSSRHLQAGLVPSLGLFLTTSQYAGGIPAVYSVCLFHGQPSKGLTFTSEILLSFDAFFLYGPLHRAALQEFLTDSGMQAPNSLDLFDIGYPKSDALIQGVYDRATELARVGLDPAHPTVLYAPAFNHGASLREYGTRILETLCRVTDSARELNVIAKLPIDCLRPASDLRANGGVDWFAEVQSVARRYPNLVLWPRVDIDGALACSDVLVTDVSSVGFEFLALGRPVVFVECQRFFDEAMAAYHPGKDVRTWKDRDTVNGGRQFGIVVKTPEELPSIVKRLLSERQGDQACAAAEMQSRLLFNPGRAAQAAVDRIDELLSSRAVSRRRSQGILAGLARLAAARATLPAKQVAKSVLGRHGLSIQRTQRAYVEATATIAAARARGLSPADYLLSRESDPRKIARPKLVLDRLQQLGCLTGIRSVLEIGPGSGAHLQQLLERSRPEVYEIYELDYGWASYLRERFGQGGDTTLRVHPANGITLSATPGESIDLVHAHAVFVYLPIVRALSYVCEAGRVLRPGGTLAFDCILDTSFTPETARAWLGSSWSFPTLVSEAAIVALAADSGLAPLARFSMPYGPATSDYLVLTKVEPRGREVAGS